MECPLRPGMLRSYFEELDRAIEKLSHKKEGFISKLPTWIIAPREITVCVTNDGQGVALKIIHNVSLESDQIIWHEVSSEQEIQSYFAPWSLSVGRDLKNLSRYNFIQMGDLLVTQNQLTPPILETPILIGFGKAEDAANAFTIESAKIDAITFWNKAINGSAKTGNFVQETRQVFRKFQAIVKLKSFLERRIHRFLYEHAKILLPSHRTCFFEHVVRFGDDERKIDFILERESGLPPILIELESPVHKVFRKNGEPTAVTNHAKNQIAEWISFIDRDAPTNARGEFSFISGPKQRLVIIGRGLEYKEKLVATKFTDTTIWTYDFLIEEARSRWNSEIASQYKIVGLPEERPF